MRLAPRLSIPVGQPTLNTSHPLCRDIKGCWAFPQGARNPVNLVTNIPLISTGSPLCVAGRGFYNYPRSGASIYYQSAPVSTKTDNFTMSIWFMHDGSDALFDGYGIFSNGNGEGSGGITIAKKGDGGGAANEFVVLINGVAWVNSGHLFVSKKWHHLVVVRRSGTLRMYMDGKVSATTSASNPGTPTTSTAIAATSSAGARDACGSFDLPMIWDRPLEPSEIYSLYANPWQIFSQQRLMFPLTVAASSFKAAWARRANVLISPGLK